VSSDVYNENVDREIIFFDVVQGSYEASKRLDSSLNINEHDVQYKRQAIADEHLTLNNSFKCKKRKSIQPLIKIEYNNK
jgi:hypothetical protein